jgi:hypothetical protein
MAGTGPVTSGNFTGNNYTVTLNQGGIYLGSTLEYDIASNAPTGKLQDGTLAITKTSQAGNTAYYSATFSAPINVVQVITSPVSATITATGLAVATGTFSHTFPVPEPGTIAMLAGMALTLAGYGLWRRRGRR